MARAPGSPNSPHPPQRPSPKSILSQQLALRNKIAHQPLNQKIGASSIIAPLENRTQDHHVYKIVELVGSSPDSIEGAIKSALARARQTLRNLRWFEVVETRGHIKEGGHHYQVTLKVGVTLEEDDAAG
jgi:hypothetical protein